MTANPIFGTSGYRDINDHRVFLLDLGDPNSDTVFVLIHGWGSNSAAWAEVLPGFLRHGRVLAPDLRGHGGTPPGDIPVTIALLIDDVIATATHSRQTRIILVGHSLGGSIATMAAVKRPDLIDGVITIDPSYGAGVREMRDVPQRLTSYRQSGGLSPAQAIDGGFSAGADYALLLRAAHSVATTPSGVLASIYESNYLTADAIGPAAGSVRWIAARRTPTLAFYPSAARARMDLEYGEQISVTVWPDSGHFLHQERPTAFIDEVERWLEGVPQSRNTDDNLSHA